MTYLLDIRQKSYSKVQRNISLGLFASAGICASLSLYFILRYALAPGPYSPAEFPYSNQLQWIAYSRWYANLIPSAWQFGSYAGYLGLSGLIVFFEKQELRLYERFRNPILIAASIISVAFLEVSFLATSNMLAIRSFGVFDWLSFFTPGNQLVHWDIECLIFALILSGSLFLFFNRSIPKTMISLALVLIFLPIEIYVSIPYAMGMYVATSQANTALAWFSNLDLLYSCLGIITVASSYLLAQRLRH